MKLIKIALHEGASFLPGDDALLHIWVRSSDRTEFIRRWNERIAVHTGMGSFAGDSQSTGLEVDHFVLPFPALFPLWVLEDALESSDFSEAQQRRLEHCSIDAHMVHTSYQHYWREAQGLEWPAQRVMMGQFPSLFLGVGRWSALFQMNLAPDASSAITQAGRDKAFFRSFFKAQGFTVADGRVVTDIDGALAVAQRIGFPVVLKRLMGGNSESVMAHLRSPEDTRAAAARLIQGHTHLIVEKQVVGTEFRLHFSKGRLVRVYQGAPLEIVGDGRRTLWDLIHAKWPDFLEAQLRIPLLADKLVQHLWTVGVRQLGDLQTVIVKKGQKLRISAATGSGVMKRCSLSSIHREDRTRFEDLFQAQGSPSCGVDLILSKAGARLSDGGAMLELNAPCGVGYLDSLPRFARDELLAMASRKKGFLRAKGRIPIGLVAPDISRQQLRKIEKDFRRNLKRVAVETLGAQGWLPLLTQSSVDGLLIRLDPASVLQWGIPYHLGARWISPADLGKTAPLDPLSMHTLRHAKVAF